MVNINKSDFSNWFSEILELAEIVDIRYPVKGMPVYMPHGFLLLKKIFDKLEQMYSLTGHNQVLFPILISEDEFKKEEEHIKGFGSDVFVTGDEERKLIMRPTSETSMYPIFKLWIQSHSQLPFKVHQTCCIYRKETKATRPLIRGREVFWNEAHTVHATAEDAKKHHELAVNIYSDLFKSLLIPFITLVRPEHDKFPGALYSVAFDTVMPDGKLLQIGTVHNLGQNFSRAYDFKVLMSDNKRDYPYQLCYGVSMRALAATISIHGDAHGLLLPTWLSEYAFVIIPIITKDNKSEIIEYSQNVADKLAKYYSVYLDLDDKTSGDKHYKWELRGIPFRIEIGNRELENQSVLIKTRLNKKLIFKISDFENLEKIKSLFNSYDTELYLKAKEFHNAHVYNMGETDSLDVIKTKKGFICGGWCENLECEKLLREKFSIEVRGFEFNSELKKKSRKCIVCKKEGFEYYFGKPY